MIENGQNSEEYADDKLASADCIISRREVKKESQLWIINPSTNSSTSTRQPIHLRTFGCLLIIAKKTNPIQLRDVKSNMTDPMKKMTTDSSSAFNKPSEDVIIWDFQSVSRSQSTDYFIC